ncbi:MAG: phosphotransferase [Caulobacterales bacterium]
MELVDKIRSAYELEQKNGVKKVSDPSEVPANFGALTHEWLTKILCKSAPGAQVTGFSFDERDDGSSNRRRIFLEYNDAGRTANMPKTVFCKAAENLQNRIVLGMSGCSRDEANFYNHVRERLDLLAPRAFWAGFDPNNFAYLIVMHDMGADVTFPTFKNTLTRAQVESMVDTMSRYHSKFYQSPELGGATLPFRPWSKFWTDQTDMLVGYEEYCDKGFEAGESVIPSKVFKRRSEVWSKTLASAARHDELPKGLIHCDVHIKNWFVRNSDGAMGLHDWQIVNIGHWSRDFVYAMATGMTVEQRRDWFDDMLTLYLDKMEALGVPRISKDDAMLNLRQQLFSVLAFWTITLRPTPAMPDMQPEDTTMEMIRRITTAMDDYDSMNSF